MMHYDSSDVKHMQTIKEGSPKGFEAFAAFDGAVFSENDHVLSKKLRELIAIAVATTTQCPHCVEIHSRGAYKAGASEEEVSEAVMVSAALRAGGAVTHGWMAMKFFQDEANSE
ncbi:carboxymuconolactone decarboxylase family protein [Nesterenkonia sp. LB17]|uniref:carboxymuconolactone decarboxylase family protein n=1 Tax=unclassified Nesterenkonia TaxID=2629769 RepID=UPI001F4C5328|nr:MULTISPECIES: carboxymuconolactone decarboxylase family protein [unclassified Nesterenkonia]MCH8559857.1 carboxymuconolactone decarboxylase family protein [Nesterenkonia sp. DZ6]MCH8564433.1 carboxymuconolactone decarboxylase family protein [Nesterenkonia sp. LB17]MCH8570059.1 carboxymuconolactone decarboxylase family protein [Nesterenkonia sp. AY15]